MRRSKLLSRALILAILTVLFMGLAAAASAATMTVEMRDNTFQPQTITVNVGDTITWTNVGQRPHDATADNGAFSSPRRMSNGQSFSWTATAPGTYTYVCTIHINQGMRGTIVVQGAGGAPAMPGTGGGGMAAHYNLSLPLLGGAMLALALVATGTTRLIRRRRAA